jgi:predicted nucleotidyltransferase
LALPERLLSLLHQAGQDLEAEGAAVASARLSSVVLVGSLARGDFRVGGSDVDLMLVHQLGELPAAEVGRRADVRAIVRHFGGPLLRVAGGTGVQKPFVMDCHFVDLEVLRSQPQWASREHFAPAHAHRDRFLWIYAFDFVAHARLLWGDNPAPAVQAYDPLPYLPHAAAALRAEVAALSALEPGSSPEPEPVSRWKRAAGELMTLLALSHGCRSLGKRDLHRSFNADVPYFQGKDFAASLWAEFLYGSVFQDRAEWVGRCRRFCQGGLQRLP